VIRLQPQTGTGLRLDTGDQLVISDPEGGQVSDFYCVSVADTTEVLSSGRTIDYGNKLLFTTSDTLYSSKSRPMATIVDDTCGRHDFLLTPCSQQTFDLLYPEFGGSYHPSCLENLTRGLETFDVDCSRIGTSFNVFMNVWWESDGTLHIDPPTSKAGDTLVLRAEMPVFVGLTACSAEKSNGGICKPIDYEVRPADSSSTLSPVTG
jgi:uncharacterized protein YcgI (DUF1989 family)